MRTLADNGHKTQPKSDVTTCQLFEIEGMIGELELKACLLANDPVSVVYLRKHLAAPVARIAVLEKFFVNLNTSLVSLTRSRCALRMKLESARPDIAWGQRVIRDLSDRVCKDYSSLVSAQSTSYRDRLYTVPADTQLKREYPSWFDVGVSKNGHPLHICDADNDEERVGYTPPSGTVDNDYEVVPPAVGLRSLFEYSVR